MFDWDDLGEKTLSKIAKIAISSQIKYAQELDVQVKTNPNLLAKGTLECLIIEAKNIQVSSSLLLDEMKIVLKEIEVNPFKALLGNIQLNSPSQGVSYFSISQNTLLQAWQEKEWEELMREDLGKVKVINQAINLSDLGQIKLKLEFLLVDENLKQFELLIKPSINSSKEIILEIIECPKGEEFIPSISDLLLKQLISILKLTDLVIDGLSFQTNQIIINSGLLILKAQTELTHFPLNK